MKNIKVGLVGVGNMGVNHCRVLNMMKHIDFIGVYDTNMENSQHIADKYNVTAYASYEQLLSDIEAVIIAAPTAYHYVLTKQAIECNKHALVEKPFVTSLTEAKKLKKLLKHSQLIIQVGHIERFNPAIEQLDRIVRRDEIINIEARRLGSVQRTMGMDVVLDLMIHDIDIVLSLVDSPLKSISSSGASPDSTGQPDVCMALLTFENGVIANLVANRISQEKIRTLSVTEKDRVIYINYMTRELYAHLKTKASLDSNLAYRTESVVEKIMVSYNEPLYVEINHFIECIRNGSDPKIGVRGAMLALEVAYKIKNNMKISIEDVQN